MPFADTEKKRAYLKAYLKKHKERRRKLQRESYLRNLEGYRKRMEKRNRKKHPVARPKGEKAAKVVKVSRARRFTIIEDENTHIDLAYFNKETGYTKKELKAIIAQMG